MRASRERSGVFISYRRDDAAAHAGRLYDHVAVVLGDQRVFIDVDAIRPGADFARRIDEGLTLSTVLLVVIGPGWVDATDRDGRRRLEDPRDVVRREVSQAIARDLLIVPVLVGGATMPERSELPPDMVALAQRNAVRLDDVRWQADVTALTAMLVDETRGRPGRVPRVLPALAVLVVIGTLAAIAVRAPDRSQPAGGVPLPSEPSGPVGPDPTAEAVGTIAYWIREPRGESGLYLLDVATRTVGRLTKPMDPGGFPSWSPDGSRLAFAGSRGFSIDTGTFSEGGTALWVADPERSTIVELLPDRVGVSHPAWSADYELAFVAGSGSATGGDVMVVRSGIGEKAEPSLAFDGDASTGNVTWSPDGEALAFVHRGGLWVMDLAARAERQIATPSDVVPLQPAWSPNGGWLVFTGVRASGTEADLYAVRPDGTGGVRLTDSAGRDEAPAWSPDGNWLVFLSNRDFQEDLWIMRTDGSDAQKLTDDADRELGASWTSGFSGG